MKHLFSQPTQCVFWDSENHVYNAGIGIDNIIIFANCGVEIDTDEIFASAKRDGVEAIRCYKTWEPLGEAIFGVGEAHNWYIKDYQLNFIKNLTYPFESEI